MKKDSSKAITSVLLDKELRRKAKKRGVNVSFVCEQALKEVLEKAEELEKIKTGAEELARRLSEEESEVIQGLEVIAEVEDKEGE